MERVIRLVDVDSSSAAKRAGLHLIAHRLVIRAVEVEIDLARIQGARVLQGPLATKWVLHGLPFLLLLTQIRVIPAVAVLSSLPNRTETKSKN